MGLLVLIELVDFGLSWGGFVGFGWVGWLGLASFSALKVKIREAFTYF